MDSVFELIRDYIDSDLFLPSKNWPDEEFKKRSYARFTAFDILRLLMDHESCDPIDILEQYLVRATCMMCGAQTRNPKLVMETVVETTQDILYLVKEAKNEQN